MWRELLVAMVTTLAAVVVDADDCQFGLQPCQWEPWTPWSACSRSCGNGTRTRSRGICCKGDETYDSCIKRCGAADMSVDKDGCGFTCPTGNCSFETIANSGIEATDYTNITGVGGAVLNPTIQLMSDKPFCEIACLKTDFPGGMFCWAFTFIGVNECHLYYFNKPLSFVPGKNGTSSGSSVKVRRCTGAPECLATEADIVFVIDSSGSIGEANFRKIKIFVQSIVNDLDIGEDLARVGVLVFSDDAKWYFKLGNHSTKLDILKAIQKIPYVPGSTQTSKALETLIHEGFRVNRTGVPAIAVVVTDGLSRYPSLTKVRAQILRTMGVRLYAIGVGNRTNHEELFNIASVPEEKYLYEFNSFDDLTNENVTLDVNYVKCKETTTARPTTQVTELTTTVTTCVDTEDCLTFGMDACTDYIAWARAHCPLFCGFCEGPKTPPQPCVDDLDCASFGTYVCTDKAFISWVDKHCKKFCGICTAPSTSTPSSTLAPTTPAPICEDTIDNCAGYNHACADPKFRGYLEARCPATCGYCQSYTIVNATVVNGLRCQEWNLPTECTLEAQAPGCCPLPRCPVNGHEYMVTAEKFFP